MLFYIDMMKNLDFVCYMERGGGQSTLQIWNLAGNSNEAENKR